MTKTTTTRALTVRFCESAPAPKKGQIEFRDAGLRGFRFRVSCGGARSFSLIYTNSTGRQQRASWSMDTHALAQAREAARAVLRAVSEGRAPEPGMRERRRRAKRSAAHVAAPANDDEAPGARASMPGTVGDLADRYVQLHLKRNTRTWKVAQGEITNYVKPNFGECAIGDLTMLDVIEAMDEILEGDSPTMANKMRKWLHAMYNWGARRGMVQSGNPVAGIEKAREAARTRFLNDDELVTVWGALQRRGYPERQYGEWMILSGCRRNEPRAMHWREINLAKRQWVIPAERVKCKRADLAVPRLVPLTENMAAMLEAMPFRDRGGFVFSNTAGATAMGNAQGLLNKLRAETGIVDWVWHDLRRTLRTGLGELRIPDEIAERVIAHERGGIAKVYNLHQYGREILEALEAWDARVRKCVAEVAGSSRRAA